MTIKLAGPPGTRLLGLGQVSDTPPQIGNAQTDRRTISLGLAPNQRSRLADLPRRTQSHAARASDSRPGGRASTTGSFIIGCQVLGRTCT